MSGVEVYVPILLNFIDNQLVYTDEQLVVLRGRVLGVENGIEETRLTESNAGRESLGRFRHRLSTLPHKPGLQTIELYYYHHRVILRYQFDQVPEADERQVRSFVLEHSGEFVQDRVIKVINELAVAGNAGVVTMYYSYVIALIENTPNFESNIENLLGSHTFRIGDISDSLWKAGRTHIVRISIPSLNLYYNERVGYFLRMNLINSVYQHMLYAKKDADAAQLAMLTSFSASAESQMNSMREEQLHNFWNFSVDALGGRSVDTENSRLQSKSFTISVWAMLISAMALALSVISILVS